MKLEFSTCAVEPVSMLIPPPWIPALQFSIEMSLILGDAAAPAGFFHEAPGSVRYIQQGGGFLIGKRPESGQPPEGL